MSPRNGRRSICCPVDGSISPPAAATTARSTTRSARHSTISAELFAEGLEIVWRAWTEPGKWSHKGRFYDFKDIEVRPRPAQQPLRPYVACFSRPSMELAARHDWNVIYAPFAAAMVYGSLADAVRVYRDTCEIQFKRPMRRAMCSYFVHIASTPEEEQYGKQALVRYFQDALIAAFPSAVGREGAADL